MNDLLKRTNYNTSYIEETYEEFADKILNYTCVPHQLEIQPGREKGQALCWMSCPYCYGGSATNSGDRLSKERYKEIIKEVSSGPNGRINKIVLAGYATDPLNYEHIDELYETSIKNNFVTGIHTKLLRYSKNFINLVANNNVPKSYISISVDAGFKESYNRNHGIETSKDILSRIYDNLYKLIESKAKEVDINTTYLLTTLNSSEEEISKSIKDLSELKVSTLRFSFPQVPRNYDYNAKENIFIKDRKKYISIINDIITTNDNKETFVSIVDPDTQYNINKLRSIPCFARFAHPAIGLDGYLYHCSESSSPDFHNMSLGNLKNKNFWDLYYSYNKDRVIKDFKKMEDNKCMCDRKLYIVNEEIKKTGLLEKMKD